MEVVADLPVDSQAAEPVQVGECGLHDPVLSAAADVRMTCSWNSPYRLTLLHPLSQDIQQPPLRLGSVQRRLCRQGRSYSSRSI
ncbi:hypothetical protein, partial [Streptomyces sp. NPDC005181]|uniref:hypothetical protein n=1 Tax=Streptomyces sp. NPDC005181 TaxID=3156869 RepID=UPI0033B7936B